MGIEQSSYSPSTLVIALLYSHAPRGRCVHFHASVAGPFLMAAVPVPIPPDVLVAALPAAEAAAATEVPAAVDNLVAPTEEVSWFLSLYRGCLLLASRSTFEMCGVCRLCYHGMCRLTSLFSWHVSPSSLFYGVSPSELVFMACVASNVVFMACRLTSLLSWLVSPSKFVFMACVAF